MRIDLMVIANSDDDDDDDDARRIIYIYKMGEMEVLNN